MSNEPVFLPRSTQYNAISRCDFGGPMLRRTSASLVLMIVCLTFAACGTTPQPRVDCDCETLPGMPDRPCDPSDTERSDYRPDSPEAVGATGRPQLLVIHYIMPPERQGMGCVA